MLPEAEQKLRAGGLDPERIETPEGTAFRLEDIPPSMKTPGVSRAEAEGFLVVADRAAAESLGRVVESGSIEVDGSHLPLHRCVPHPGLARVGERIPEGRDNLARRGAWFKKRH
jgi:hypothetical protein